MTQRFYDTKVPYNDYTLPVLSRRLENVMELGNEKSLPRSKIVIPSKITVNFNDFCVTNFSGGLCAETFQKPKLWETEAGVNR